MKWSAIVPSPMTQYPTFRSPACAAKPNDGNNCATIPIAPSLENSRREIPITLTSEPTAIVARNDSQFRNNKNWGWILGVFQGFLKNAGEIGWFLVVN
jgi:hypothetical protein